MSVTLFEKIACLGYGKMCRALVQGANLPRDKVVVTGRSLLKGQIIGRLSNVTYRIVDNRSAVENADCIIFAVKPAQLEDLCKEIKGSVKPDALILSVVAGKTTETIQEYLDCKTQPIVRTMPNTPVSVKKGVIGLYSNPFVTPSQAVEVHKILNQIGTIIAVTKQHDLNKLTALSGCGPAYYFRTQELIAIKAEQLGFDKATASRIAAHTMWGASALQENSGLSAADEITRVASKGGATEKALEYFEQHGISALFDGALEAALQQTYKLGEPTVSQINMFQANTEVPRSEERALVDTTTNASKRLNK